MARCKPSRHKWIITISTCWVVSCFSLVVLAGQGPTPTITSTVLKIQKFYMTNPPHDTKLYDILHVTPNATSTQITKSYRNLAKRFHPDKVTTTASTTDASQFSKQLQQIQDAYEILKDDTTRLPYHQYGLTDPNVAVAILLGPHHSSHQCHHLLEKAHHELLQLMGYELLSSPSQQDDPSSQDHDHHHVALDAASRQEERIRYIATRLVERLRPLVEESVSPGLVLYQLARDCDEWKRLPLGAQIVRCIGRAYRHAGRDYLSLLQGRGRPKQSEQQPPPTLSLPTTTRGNLVNYYSVPVRQQWRKAKAFWTAVLATGKATVTEKAWMQQEQQRRLKKQKQQQLQKSKTKKPEIDYYSQGLGELPFVPSDKDGNENDDYDASFTSDDDDNDNAFDEEEMKYMEQFRAKQTILTSLQVEALWKVAKIDLDRVIRRACRLILTREYFFDPSHQMLFGHHVNSPPTDGWVTSQGKLINSDEALQRTAKALILLGDVMVARSKVETSWKD